MDKLIFSKYVEEETGVVSIFLNSKLIHGYEEMFNIIFNNSGKDMEFTNFNDYEMKFIRIVMIEYNEYLNRITGNAQEMEEATHILRYRDRRMFSFSEKMNNSLDYLELSEFDKIDVLEFVSNDKEFGLFNVIVEGSVCLYGIKNEYGFYDTLTNNFFSNREIKNGNMIVEDLEDNVQFCFGFERRRTR